MPYIATYLPGGGAFVADTLTGTTVTATSSLVVGTARIRGGTADPNVALVAGGAGDIYVRTGGANASLWINIDGTTTGWLNTRAAGDSTMFGDGSDGALTVAGTTTEAGATDRYYTDGSIGAAGVYNTAGRILFFSGTLTVASGGVIRNLGNNAAGAVAGAASASLAVFPGTAGGAGGAAAGSAGTNASASTRCFSPSAHGQGGAGGAGSGGAGGSAGTAAALSTTVAGGRSSLVTGPARGFFTASGAAGATLGYTGGIGGGGGGGSGGASGGGGGGGGGVIAIIARRIVFAGATPILASGGNGAAGTAVDCGGGGGGGGGSIVLVTRQYLGPTLTAATHCPGGSSGASGGGSGVAGTAGSNGFVIAHTI